MDIYEIFSLISVICTVLCVLCVILSVVLFFVFKIPEVIGFLSGSTARKSVEKLEKVTTASGPLSRRIGRTGKVEKKKVEHGKHAAVQKQTSDAVPQPKQNIADGAEATGVLDNQGTSLLQENWNQTTVLQGQQQNGMPQEAGATSVLNAEAGSTALLSECDPLIMTPQMQHELGMGLTTSLDKQDDKVIIGTFNVLLDIVFTHSDEVI